MFNLLPNLSVEELLRSFAIKSNDMMLAVYLASMIRRSDMLPARTSPCSSCIHVVSESVASHAHMLLQTVMSALDYLTDATQLSMSF